MARTYRQRAPGLVKAIKDRMHDIETGNSVWDERDLRRYFSNDPAILRGQDGAIRMDKCVDANIDREGAFKLDGRQGFTYRKNNVREIKKKQRTTNKIIIRNQLA